ncbi:MAG TPA: carboxypeptidase regulatory-like domain-containing protein [Candidatus Angelobacter sp.]|nr:carboxypeptidase regulatory-like domain-containing protein [Candidatus Angelobacter sp.]
MLAALLLLSGFCRSGASPAPVFQSAPLPSGQVQVSVMDQNGLPLGQVFVIVQQNDKTVAQGRTTPTGTAVLRQLPPGTYKLLLEKSGFYTAVVAKLVIVSEQASPVEVRLQPVREYREEIEVTAHASPIDPDEISNSQTITATDISNIPYATTRDYRNVLPFMPGVIGDQGQIHIAGASTQEIQDYLDGFEVSQPATGALALRVNPDSLRKVDVRSSRYSAQFGKGSGGLVDLQLQDGDNKFRVNATDLLPTFQNVKGFQINNWTPRGYFSGPLVRDKAWFDLSHEGETDYNIVKQLPDNADTNRIWRIDDLARLRVNLAQGNVLTASALLNMQDSQNTGISAFDPVSVSLNNHSYLYVLSLKDQMAVTKSTMLEFGASFHRNKGSSIPMGDLPYVLGPDGRSGNFPLTNQNISTRTQAFANLFLQPWKWMGTHQFTVGGRADRVLYDAQISRGTAQFVDANNALLRQTTFSNPPPFSLGTVETSAFVQDRWSPFQRMIIEPGVRWDHDSFLGQSYISPRIAGTVLLSPASETKFSAGIGIYYDRTNLSLASNGSQGTRTDEFFSPVVATFPETFVADPRILTLPRFVNWSVALERRLPGKVYARLEFLSRHGQHGWAYELEPGNLFLLRADKQDHFDAALITLRKELKRGYPVQVSYMRSRAVSNQTVDFFIDELLIGNQVGGPLPWDVPNQVNAWGIYPMPWKFKKFDFAWSTIWHTGFTFVTNNQFGQIVSGPGEFRFPDFFTLNLGIERKFNFKGYRWAARLGLVNVTDRSNPSIVDTNINSPTFLSFFGTDHRTLAGRLRFLGKAERTH